MKHIVQTENEAGFLVKINQNKLIALLMLLYFVIHYEAGDIQ